MLGEQIRKVYLAPHLPDLDRTNSQLLLKPNSVRLKMPQLAETGTGRDADGRTRILPDSYWHLEAEICHDRLVTKACSGGLHKAIKLRLPRGQSNRWLSGRPRSDHVPANHDTAAGG